LGVILDSSVPIRAQRLRMTEGEMLKQVRSTVGDVELATSVIVVTELLQGIFPASTLQIRERRRKFLEEFMLDMVVHSYTLPIAEIAGKIGGEQIALGLTIPTVDLMIGATALSLNFSILTTNVRHFNLIPGLRVIPF
jgi:tRNA(fMet)-specific endonuclease VapC